MYNFIAPSFPSLHCQNEVSSHIPLLVACAHSASKDERLLLTNQPLDPLEGADRAIFDEGFNEWLETMYSCKELTLKKGECTIKPSSRGFHLIVVGVGSLNDLDSDAIRLAFCKAARVILKKGYRNLQFVVPTLKQEHDLLPEAAYEGLLLGQAPLGKGADKKGVYFESLIAIDKDYTSETSIFSNHQAKIKAEANLFARHLVNANANDMTPKHLAKIAYQMVQDLEAVAPEYSLEYKVLDEVQIEEEGLGLLKAVAQGASTPPRLIILTYQPRLNSRIVDSAPIMLVGKGISYDTGGLSLKPTESMLTMRSDMAGAAAVLTAFQAAVKLQLKTPIVAILAAAENAVGPNSYKLGDVFQSYSSKTVQITNTDAEGRLVLADAISYGIHEYKPSCIIDIATLTGAARVALGLESAALISNSQVIADELMRASSICNERVWPLPNFKEYFDYLESDVADMKNSAGAQGGCCIAASFIQQFIQDIPWAHLDIAPVAFLEQEKDLLSKCATGFGARLLIQWLIEKDRSLALGAK
jgi:leucyl aminopeptidase